MNNRETNENMHSNSTRANFVNRIPCFMRKHPRTKTKGKTYKTVWKPNALSTKPSQTTRYLKRFNYLHNQ